MQFNKLLTLRMIFLMKIVLISIIAIFCLAACTTIEVSPVKAGFNAKLICIEKNPEVKVKSFLPVLRNRIEHLGYLTITIDGTSSDDCNHILSYKAHRSWDGAFYLSRANLYLRERGETIAQAEYRLKGSGGFSLLKWNSTKSKMEPVIDELFGRKES